MKKRILILLIGLMMIIGAMGILSSCGDDPAKVDPPTPEQTCTHDWEEATCTTAKTCKLCGDKLGEALGHVEANVGKKDPTCTETGLTAGKICTRCQEVTVAQNVVPALGHKYPSNSLNCSVCGLKRPDVDAYQITVLTIGNRPLTDVPVMIYNESGVNVGGGPTDANGTVTFTLSTSTAYTAKFMLDGAGQHILNAKGYKFNADGYEVVNSKTEIVLTPGVIASESESDYAKADYGVGDIMYDFTFTNIDGDKVQLSELLTTGGKKGVLLNFWFTTCSPCESEFPFIQAVYERYQDEISVIAIDPMVEDDKAFRINEFVTRLGLTFDVINGGETLAAAFGVEQYPTSVFIDRYGTITFIEIGALPQERPFEALFSRAVAEDYKQVIYNNMDELLPREEVDIEMESSDKVGGVLNYGEIDVFYYPEEGTADALYSWPFIITEKNGVPCLKPSNTNKPASYSMMHADVTFDLSKGDALVFDYLTSTEAGVDVLYVLVNGVDITAISGVETDWKTCCTYVALEDGEYTVSFVYIKDGTTDYGDDTVYIKDLRIENSATIDVPSYIQREAATVPSISGDGYDVYADIYLGADGYYHVGSETGPLLMADLNGYTLFNDKDSIYNLAYNGEIKNGDISYFDKLLPFFRCASHSDIPGLCPVTETLAELLKEIANIIGTGTYNHNDWLEICKYYDAYGTNGVQLADPVKGLAPFSAFDTVVNTETDPEDYYPNTVTYTKLIMPRGLLYEFIPAKSGVYCIESDSDSELLAWIFNENHEIIQEYDPSQRFPTVDYKNICMYRYFEKDVKYYIDIAFYESTEMGSFDFKIEYVAEEHKLFMSASPGPFTYALDEQGNVTDKLIALGIDVALGEDGYYHHVLPVADGKCDNCKNDISASPDSVTPACTNHVDKSGKLGSIVYADFSLYTNIFDGSIYNSNSAVKTLISTGKFDFTYSDEDQFALLNGFDKITDDNELLHAFLRAHSSNYDELTEEEIVAWGASKYDPEDVNSVTNFEAYYDLYKIDDLRAGKYHGLGTDCTDRVIWYAENKMISADNSDDPNLYGCVAVDEELGMILQMLMDKCTFKNVKNSWTKLSYYYLYLGPEAEA